MTEKATQTIDTYVVGYGYAIGPKVQASNGATPFGFRFGHDGRLYVSEASPAPGFSVNATAVRSPRSAGPPAWPRAGRVSSPSEPRGDV